jgi:SulP family sulfate permease
VLIGGSSLLSFVPTALVGALLVYLGATFVVDWLWDRRNRLAPADYGLVLGAGAAVIILGFLPAIAIGTVVAILLFVVRYSRIEAVRHAYTLRQFRSSIERSPDRAGVLEEFGGCAVVLEVHGFLFFGTAHGVFGDERLFAGDTPLRYALFDMTGVTGIDSSTSMALAKLTRRANAEGFEVILAGLPDARQMTPQLVADAESVRRFETLDAAVEWCEEQILAAEETGKPQQLDPQTLLADSLGSDDLATNVLQCFDRLELGAGDYVIRHGSDSPGLFLIESGNLTAQLDIGDGVPVKLRTMQPGTLVGEISLYQNSTATADVLATEPAVVLHLPIARLLDIERSDPATAAAIHRLASQTLADRVLHAERALRTFRG